MADEELDKETGDEGFIAPETGSETVEELTPMERMQNKRQEQLRELREMGPKEYEKRKVDLVNQMPELFTKVRDTVIEGCQNKPFLQKERGGFISQAQRTYRFYREDLTETAKVLSIDVSYDLDDTWYLDEQDGVTDWKDHYVKIVVIDNPSEEDSKTHESYVPYPVWFEVRKQLTPEQLKMLKLVKTKKDVEREIEGYNESRSKFARLGIDMENPQIFKEETEE